MSQILDDLKRASDLIAKMRYEAPTCVFATQEAADWYREILRRNWLPAYDEKIIVNSLVPDSVAYVCNPPVN